MNTSGIISGTQLVLLWNWSLQLETSLGSQSLSTMRIWILCNRNFGSFVTVKRLNYIQVEDDQICQGGRLKGIFLRGERAIGIEKPCSIGLLGGQTQGMSSSSGRQMRGWRFATRAGKTRTKPGAGCSLVSGEKEEGEFALNHRAEKLFFRWLSHTYKIFFKLLFNLYDGSYNIYVFLILKGALI